MAIKGIGPLRGADESLNHQIVDTFATVAQSDFSWTEKIWGSIARTDGTLQVDFGLPCLHREWYRAFQGFKLNVILLLGAMLFDSGASDDLRLGLMGSAIPMLTQRALEELGIDEALDPGPVTARQERLRAVRDRVQADVRP